MKNDNRVSGGKKGKLDGHANEERIRQLIESNEESKKELLGRIGKGECNISSVSVGGLHEKSVQGIVRKKTKLKTDMKIAMDGTQETVNISVKKGLEDQAYLVKSNIFISLFEKSYSRIEEDVKTAMRLFWAADTEKAEGIIKRKASNNKELQLKHKSVNADTLKSYNEQMYLKLLQWFKDNIDKIVELVFSRGDVANEKDWAHFLWYKNMLGDHTVDEIFSIDDISKAATRNKNAVKYGDKNGGTTIQLPFGKVQWHKKSMQFRHDYAKIKELMEGVSDDEK